MREQVSKHMFHKLITLGICLQIISTSLSPALDTSGFFQPDIQLESINNNPGSVAITRRNQSATDFIQYLPVAQTGDDFSHVPAIWFNAEPPGRHQITLFRRSFTTPRDFNSGKLEIFADTRYEIWLDGEWIGRGPARFSHQLVEYDIYTLDNLSPGEHTLAVLVQWAPNVRRSESYLPKLQVRLSTIREQGRVIIEQTGPHWLAALSDAWNLEAAPVHAWDLIGPTELLDLNRLSSDWMQPEFDDSTWQAAQLVEVNAPGFLSEQFTFIDPISSVAIPHLPQQRSADFVTNQSATIYQPRSIPLLEETPIEPQVIRQGSLAPDRKVIEIISPGPWETQLTNSSSSSQLLTIEMLSLGSPPDPGKISVNHADLNWNSYHAFLPDLYRAQVSIPPGSSTLSVPDVPPEGLTLSVSEQFVTSQAIPVQGNHAGRRLYLASYPQNPALIQIGHDQGLDITFNQTPAYVLLDLGKVTYGRVNMLVTGPEGSLLDMGWDERLYPGTQRALPYPGSLHSTWNQTDSWVLDSTTRQIHTLDARAGRYILIAAWGPGPVILQNVSILAERYPGEVFGSFQSSEPLLDQIWKIGVDTLQINKTDAYTDTPWRERGQWWGDAYVESQIDQVTFGGTDLLRRGVELMAYASNEGSIYGLAPHGNGVNMLDYAMLWVLNLRDLAWSGNHLSDISRSYLTLMGFMEHLETYQNPETGLLDLPSGHWSETAYIDTLGYRDRRGQSTALNSLYYHTLLVAADLAKLRGDWQKMQVWQLHAETVKNQVNALLYQPAQDRFASSYYADSYSPASISAQAWALSYDLVPQENRSAVIAAMLDLLGRDPSHAPIGTYGFYWILRALGENDETEAGLEIIRNFYGYMLDQGATTWWEWFQADQDYQNSLSHGWGSSPTWFLSRYILGINAMEGSRWELTPPALESLDKASGAVPHLAGIIEVAWERYSCGQVVFNYAAPAGHRGNLNLPKAYAGQPVWLDGMEIHPAEQTILPGSTHQLKIGPDCNR